MSNITNNRINQTIPPADQATAKQHFIDLNLLLPFLVGLEGEEKKGMQGINVSNKQWVEDCLNEMEQDPSILPGFINPLNVKNDYTLFLELDKIIVHAKDFLDKLSDTQYLAGAEAYAVCLIYYRLAEAAAKAGLPGADERYNRLKERFVQSPEPPKPTPPPADGPDPMP